MKISFDDISLAAQKMGIEPCALYALCVVESSGDGFLPDGRPKILFEAHIFWRELKNMGWNPAQIQLHHPTILSPKWTKAYYKGGAKEYDRLNEACLINEEAALKSCSFGLWQIMGFNYEVCGFKSVFDFVAAMNHDYSGQMDALYGFLKNNGILPYLKAKNWREVAKRYNGSGFSQNQYDKKLEAAYSKCKAGK